MRVIMSGIAAAFVLGVIAAVVLSAVQKPAYDLYSTSSTRLGDPGSNLVGEAWTGEPKVERNESYSARGGAT
jgi:hypothetical protein